MAVQCTSCGHGIPSGQFRCGKCGAAQTRDSLEDYAGLSEVAREAEGADAALSLGAGPEVAARASFRSETTGTRAALREPTEARSDASREIKVEPRTDARDDEQARESMVPKGTFASDTPAEEPPKLAPEPAPAELSAQRREASGPVPVARERGEASGPVPVARERGDASGPVPVARERGEASGPVPVARERGDSTPSKPIAATSSQQRKARHVAPPYLASAILREDLAPTEPGRQVLVRALRGAGTGGIAATLIAGESSAPALLLGLVFCGLLLLSRLDLSYGARATISGSISGIALGVTSWWRVALGGRIDGPWLGAATTLLVAALLFRAWYRGSNTARYLVGIALVLALAWAAMSSSRALLQLGFDWRSWLPALTWYLFVLLCLLSLLAFMGDETTGGCDAWAVGLVFWFGLYALERYATGSFATPPASPAMAVLGLAEPALAAPAAVSLAQLLARVFGPRNRRLTETEQSLAGPAR